MTLKKYRVFEFVNIVIIAGLIFLALVLINPWIPAPVIITALGIGLYLRGKVKELAVDERINAVAEKSLAFAAVTFIMLSVMTGLILVALGQDRYPAVEPVGFTLTVSASAVTLLYYAASLYYQQKLGGKV